MTNYLPRENRGMGPSVVSELGEADTERRIPREHLRYRVHIRGRVRPMNHEKTWGHRRRSPRLSEATWTKLAARAAGFCRL